MKNASIILNIVLLIAVGFLYYKVYSGPQAPPAAAPVKLEAGSGMPSNAIVFLNSDSLLEEYNFFNTMKEKLEAKQDSIDKTLNIKAKVLEQDVVRYQEKAPVLSAEQRAQEEEKLMGRQQSLMQLKQTMIEELQMEEMAMNDSIHDNLTRFLREYNKDKNYLYILGFQRGNGILLANDSLDITKEVLEGLNKQ